MSFRPPGTDHLAGRNAGIDLIRGISIVLVVIHHTSLRIPVMQTSLSAILPKRFLTGLGSDGYEAVFVFFVVSGFLITTNSIRRWTSLARLGQLVDRLLSSPADRWFRMRLGASTAMKVPAEA